MAGWGGEMGPGCGGMERRVEGVLAVLGQDVVVARDKA